MPRRDSQRRVDFIEELLETLAEMRLRGGGKRAGSVSAQLPDHYEAVLRRTQHMCGGLAKPQIKTILRADKALCERLNKADDASLHRIVMAAAKRLGMHEQGSRPPSVENVKDGAQKRDTGAPPPVVPHIAIGEAETKQDEDTLPVLTLESTFDVPTVTSLRPGENGVLLAEGMENVSKLLNRFAGSSGTGAVITPTRCLDIAVEPVELVLLFKRTVPDKPAQKYTALAYLYRLTGTTPQVKDKAPVYHSAAKRKSVVMGCEVPKVKDATELYQLLQVDKPDYVAIKKQIGSILGEKLGPALLECFMDKQGTNSMRVLVVLPITSGPFLLPVVIMASSGHQR